MPHSPSVTYVDSPSTATPLSAANLNASFALPAGNVVMVPPATGVGTTDRTAIQTALSTTAVAGDTVKLQAGSTYVVNLAGTSTTPSHGATLYRYCLMIPSGVTLDLNGSTLKLDAGVDASVVRGPTAGGTNIGLTGFGTIDGNSNSITDLGGYAVYFDGIDGLHLEVNIIDTSHGAVVFEDCTKIVAPRIVVDTCDGVGIGLGTGSAPLSDCWFGLCDVRNVTQWAPNIVNFPGNSIAGVLIRSHMQTVAAVDCEAAIKVDAGSIDWTFGDVYVEGCTTSNSGLKFQGTGAGTPLRCHAGHLHTKDNAGMGVFFEQCTDCSVGSFIGQDNNTLGTTADVWIGGTRDTVNSIRSTGSKTSPVVLRATAVDYRLGIVTIRNPGNASNGVTDSGATGAIGQLVALDDRGGSALMDRGYRSNSASSVCHIGHADIRGATVAPITRTAGDKVTVGMLRTHASNDLAVQTLGTDVAFTLTPGTSPQQTLHSGTLTANRIVTLSTTGVFPGCTFEISRTGAGAFTLDVGTGPLKSLATNTWGVFRYDGTNWKLVRYGAL